MCWPGAATYADAAVLESTLASLTLGSFMRRLRAFISLQPVKLLEVDRYFLLETLSCDAGNWHETLHHASLFTI